MNSIVQREQEAARRQIDEAVAECDAAREKLIAAVTRAKGALIPVAEIATRAKVSRTTIYEWVKPAE